MPLREGYFFCLHLCGDWTRKPHVAFPGRQFGLSAAASAYIYNINTLELIVTVMLSEAEAYAIIPRGIRAFFQLRSNEKELSYLIMAPSTA